MSRIAIWALTPNGARLAGRCAAHFRGAAVFVARQIPAWIFQDASAWFPATRFDRLRPELQHRFRDFEGHIFIMSTGIVVRLIAPLLRAKTEDPAVVVLDERGLHAISLLSGHIGGANALTRRVAEALGATAVITTATDIQELPAVDAIAVERGLRIENPAAIRTVSMALLNGDSIGLHDPMGWLGDSLDGVAVPFMEEGGTAGVWVDHWNRRNSHAAGQRDGILRLRPPTLVAGMGCNRGTGVGELRRLLWDALAAAALSPLSLAAIASVDVKADEPGLMELARELGIPFWTFPREALRAVTEVPTPSELVARHVGTPSVCEAAALLAAGEGGALWVTKRKSANGTVAVAGRESGPERRADLPPEVPDPRGNAV